MPTVDNEKLFPLVILPGSDVIAAGPLTKQPGTVLFRIVLRHDRLRNDFIVHDEQLARQEDGSFRHVSFGHGDYCHQDLEYAVERFSERLQMSARFMKSLDR